MPSATPYHHREIAASAKEATLEPTRRGQVLGVLSTIGVSLGVFGFFAVQGIVLARMLGPQGRGEFAVANLYAQALLYVCMLGAPEIFARLAANSSEDASIRRAALRYASFTGVFTIIVCTVLSFLTIKPSQYYLIPLVILCAVGAAAQQVRIAIQAVDHGKRKMFRYNVSRLIAGAVFPIGLLIGWVLGFQDVQSAALISLITSISALGLCSWGMLESWVGHAYIRVTEALTSAKSLVGSIAINELMERSDMILIVWFLSATQLDTVGAYAAAVPIASVMLIIPNAVSLYVFNRAARPDELPRVNELWSTFSALLVVQTFAGLALGLLIPYLLPFLYGERFENAIWFAQALIPAAALRGILQAGDAYLRARNLSMKGIPPRIVGITLLFCVSIGAWESMGAFAVPLGLTIAQVISCIFVTWAIHKDLKEVGSQPTAAS